jgi:carbonic anhydrase
MPHRVRPALSAARATNCSSSTSIIRANTCSPASPFDLECHFVHRSAAGDLAVIGVFIRPGETNRALEPVWSAMPRQEGPERDAGTAVDPGTLMPAERGFFRYMGSLTTPPCTQGIVWTLFQQSIEASPEQIRQFAALYADNARSIQGHNRRFLLRTS